MDCKDCNKNIQASPDSTVKWTGGDFQSLGIQNNTSLKTVLTQMAKALEKIQQPIENIDKSTDDVKVSGTLLNLTGKVSACSGDIINRNFTYSIKQSLSGLEFTYDLNETIDNLPSMAGSLGVDVSIVGTATYGNVNILDSKKNVGGVNIPIDRLPVTATLKIFLSTTCGNIELIKRILVDGTVTGTFRESFDLNDAGTNKTEYNQTEANTLMITALNNATRDIGNLKAEIATLKSK